MMMRAFGTMTLAVFLLLLATMPALASDAAKGEELVKSLGCMGCHKIGDSGGSIGPALDKVGKRLEEAQIRKQLVDPKADNPKSMMPSYQRLSATELDALVDYLESLK